jgi:hypothetical protein
VCTLARGCPEEGEDGSETVEETKIVGIVAVGKKGGIGV